MQTVAARWIPLVLALTLASEAGAAAPDATRSAERQHPPVAAASLLAQAQAAEKALPFVTDAAALREIEGRFIAALEIAPHDRVLRAGLAGFYRRHGYELDTPGPALLELLARDADPAGLAVALAGAANDGVLGNLGQTLLLAALRRQPQQPVLWYELARRTYDPATRLAYFAEATARARALRAPGADAARVLAAAEIAELLASGLLAEALTEISELPDSTRRALEDAPVAAASLDVLGLRLVAPARDLRPDLAVAEAVTGDPRRAAARIAGLPWHLRLASSTRPASTTVVAALVHCAIGDVPGDPFRFVYAALIAQPGAGGAEPLDSAAHWRLIATVAHRRGAQHLEAHALERTEAFAQPCDTCDAPLPANLAPPPAVAGRALTLRAAFDRLASEASTERAALLGEIDARDRVASGIARRPRADSVFTESRLPARDTTGEEEPTAETGDAAAARRDAGEPGPAGRPAAALFDRADLDPAGAFWLELERAAGGTEAVFTGLTARRYDVVAHSELPLLDGGTVQIEARDAEAADPADPQSAAPRVLLRAALADLRADADGDGLTDVVEARWHTDPERADTDGDGLADAVDPSPLVPAGSVSPLAEPLALALAEVLGFTTEVLAASRTPSCCHALLLPTEIVVAPRSLLAGVGSAARLLVFAPLEREARPEEAGRRGAVVLSLIYFDDAVEHGIVEWWRDASGGTLRLDRRADGWHVTHVTDWVS